MTADWLLAGLRHDRAIVLGGLAIAIVLAWAYLLAATFIDFLRRQGRR